MWHSHSMPKPLSELIAPDWAAALADVEPTIHRIGEFLREEIAAGRGYLPAPENVLRAFTRPMADVRVPETRIETLVEQLEAITAPEQVDGILVEFHEPGESGLEHESTWMEEAFGVATVEDIFNAVEIVAAQENEVAQKALKALQRHSPTGLKVTLEAVRRAKDLTFAEVLAQDLRTTMHAMEGVDLAEGIRAQIIDKDRNPQWDPQQLIEVTDAAVQAFFGPVDGIDDLTV